MRNFFLLYILGIVPAILSSCVENDSFSNSEENIVRTIHVSSTKFQLDEALSRKALTIDEINGGVYTWEEEDMIGIFPDEGNQVGFSMADGAGTNEAVFTGGGWGLKKSSSYSAYFPLIHNFDLDRANIEFDYTGQNQQGNNSALHMGAYDFSASPYAEVKDGRVSFVLEHLAANVRIKILMPTAGTYTKLRLKTNGDFVSKVSYNLETNTLTNKLTSSSFDLKLSNVNLEANQELVAYVTLSPTNLSSETITAYILDSEGKEYEAVLQSKNFLAGYTYLLSGTATECAELGNCGPIGVVAVDLGLPSGTLWANMNVGATSIYKKGNLYAWGETEVKSTYTSNNYFDKTYTLFNANNYSIIGTEYDVAHVVWGDDWVMPTTSQWHELRDNCTWKFNGSGSSSGGYYTLTGPNGNTIVLPATTSYVGNDASYWSGELKLSSPEYAFCHYHRYRVEQYQLFADKYITSQKRYESCGVRAVINPK